MNLRLHLFFFFFFNDTATTEIYTLSLHDALPICIQPGIELILSHVVGIKVGLRRAGRNAGDERLVRVKLTFLDPKRTRLNSRHLRISYALFFLEKKKK